MKDPSATYIINFGPHVLEIERATGKKRLIETRPLRKDGKQWMNSKKEGGWVR
jgi:hypothetical protein